MKKFVWFLLIILFAACEQQQTQNKHNYFIWSRRVSLSYFNNCNGECYIHFFDVVPDYVFGAIPANDIYSIAAPAKNANIVPTVYIDYKIFYKINLTQTQILAERVLKRINEIFNGIYFSSFSMPPSPDTSLLYDKILIDCDWTPQTKSKYFLFLKTLRKKLGDKKLLVTVRLHQLTDVKNNGIPPADEGVLMVYNVEKIEDWETQNSILNMDLVKSYFKRAKKYPLKLDLALAVYSWAVVFRDNKIRTLIRGLRYFPFLDTFYLEKIDENRYIAKQGFYWNNERIYPGEQIRLEYSSLDDLQEVKKLFLKSQKYKTKIILFSYEQINENIFDTTAINNIFAW